jgi:hypothetical protein
MLGLCFGRTVKFKSPHNIFARRFRRVIQAAWCPERGTWVCYWESGKKAEIPSDCVVIFGKDVSVT